MACLMTGSRSTRWGSGCSCGLRWVGSVGGWTLWFFWRRFDCGLLTGWPLCLCACRSRRGCRPAHRVVAGSVTERPRGRDSRRSRRTLAVRFVLCMLEGTALLDLEPRVAIVVSVAVDLSLLLVEFALSLPDRQSV